MQNEILEHPDFLRVTKFVDEGSFGQVYQAVDETTGKLYAIKRIPNYATITNKAAGNRAYAKKIVREVMILSLLNADQCEYIVPLNLVYLSADKRDVYLVMPFIEFNLDHIVRMFVLREPEIKAIAYQLLAGIKGCHDRHLMHRDLTLKNVLIDSDSHVRIADFGLSRCKDTPEEEATLEVVTLEYRAPELLLRYKKYDTRVDIWSIGCMVAEMYLQRRLFVPESRDEPHAVRKIVQLLGAPDMAVVQQYGGHTTAAAFVAEVVRKLEAEGKLEPPFQSVTRELQAQGASDEAISLIRWMLQFDFLARPTAAQALEHPWFADDPDMQEASDEGVTGGETGGSQSENPQQDVQMIQQQQQQQQHGACGLLGGDSAAVADGNSMQQQQDGDTAKMKSFSSQDDELISKNQPRDRSPGRDGSSEVSPAAAAAAAAASGDDGRTHKKGRGSGAGGGDDDEDGAIQQQKQQPRRPKHVGADGAALLSPIPDLNAVTDQILCGDDNDNDGEASGTESGSGMVSTGNLSRAAVGDDGASGSRNGEFSVEKGAAASAASSSSNININNTSQQNDDDDDQQQQGKKIPEWISVSVDAQPAQENNALISKIQTMKLAQLQELMQSVAAKNLRMIRGEYQINDASAPGMVLENSQSPVDST